MFCGRPTHGNGQQDQQEGNFAYDSTFPQAPFVPAAQYHGQAAFQGEHWGAPAGLPDDDDPLLQRRLQQLVEQHKPSRNVLRELADVAEQQTPSGTKRKAFDDDTGSDDDDGDPRKNCNKRKAPQAASVSRARKQMDAVMSKQHSLRQSIKNLESQMKALQQQLGQEKVQLVSVEQLVHQTSQELVEELLLDKTTWNQMYYQLVDFHSAHGHLRVPWRKEDKEKDPITARLGPWLVQQRKDYRRDEDDPERLEPYKIVALENLEIEWEPFRQHWFNRYEDLKRYKEEHGDCRVPYCSGRSQKKRKYEEEEEDVEDGEDKVKYDSLGVWVKRQRNQYKNFKAGNKEKSGEMTEERIQLLESIGFEWCLRSGPEPNSWIDSYNELKAFKEDHGHTRVDEKENKALSEWVKQMRTYIKKFNENQDDNALTLEQYNLLKEIELDSSLRESKFGARFSELMEFKEHHGHCLVPASYAANQKLSNWVQTQKRQYKLMKEGKKSQMTEEKYQLLAEAGFEFEVSKERKSEAMKSMDKSWDEFFAELEQYKEKYGQINSIKQRKKKALREWCDEQRVQHARLKWGKESTITDDEVAKLTELGFVWTSADTPSKGWYDFFGDLLTVYVKTGSFNIPDGESELKEWAETQKIEYQKFVNGVPSLLSHQKIEKLNEVSFMQQSSQIKLPTKGSWEEMFGQLLAFKIQNNHFNIPHSMKELHAWTCQQRHEKIEQSTRKSSTKRSAIWEERVRRLTEVGFDWDGPLPPKTTDPSRSLSGPTHSDSLQTTSIQTGLPYPMLNNYQGNQHGLSFPTNWNPATSMQQISNAASSSALLMSPNMLASMANGVGAPAGRDLASQAAQIVADIRNRKAIPPTRTPQVPQAPVPTADASKPQGTEDNRATAAA